MWFLATHGASSALLGVVQGCGRALGAGDLNLHLGLDWDCLTASIAYPMPVVEVPGHIVALQVFKVPWLIFPTKIV